MNQDNIQVSSAAVSDKGLSEKRPQNEDSYLLLSDSGLFAVADGVGGAQAGDVASEMAVEILGEAFINLGEGGDAEDRMRVAIDKANSAIYQMSRDLPQLSTMATTLVALHISGNIATIGHVGDSRLYRLDPKGMLFRETQDHSVVAEEVRAGRMTDEQAETHPSRNVISRALGADATVEIDMKTIMFEPGTTFMVCSDGVTRHIPDEEIRDLLFMEDDAEKACEIIKRRCYDRGAEDNLTAVVVKIPAAAEEADDFSLLELDPEETETVATARVGGTSGQLFPEIAEPTPGVSPVVDDEFELDVIEDPEDTRETLVPPYEEKPADRVADTNEPGGIEETAPGVTEPPEIEPQETDPQETKPAATEPPGTEPPGTEPPGTEPPETRPREIEPLEFKSSETGTDISKPRQEASAYKADEFASAELVGKMLTGLVWLAVGILVGALGYFMITSTFGSAPGSLDQTSQSILTFEQLRRQVDTDPAKYIAAYGTAENKSAADHYLIGRSYLLQKNYGAAKTSFESAKSLLAEEDVSNRSILEHDIAAGLSIANIKEAQEVFEAPAGQGPGEESDEEVEPKGD